MKVHKGPIITSAEAILKAEKMLGSERALAAKIGVSRQNLNYWKFNTLLPYDKALAIYIATNGEVDINDLRSDCRGLTKKAEMLVLKKHGRQQKSESII